MAAALTMQPAHAEVKIYTGISPTERTEMLVTAPVCAVVRDMAVTIGGQLVEEVPLESISEQLQTATNSVEVLNDDPQYLAHAMLVAAVDNFYTILTDKNVKERVKAGYKTPEAFGLEMQNRCALNENSKYAVPLRVSE
jgi:mannitol-specific phosphotransferase system IIBC component